MRRVGPSLSPGRRILLGFALVAGYVAAFAALHRPVGLPIGALSFVPVAIAAFYLGQLGTLAVGAALLPVNVALYRTAGMGLRAWPSHALPAVAVTLVAVLVARMRRMQGELEDGRERLEQLLREQVEAARAREELQAKLLISERMASLGTLAGGVAHEINNPLAYVLSSLRYLSGALGERGVAPDRPAVEARQAVADALEGAERVRRIVHDLQAFAHPGGLTAPVDVRRVIERAIHVAEAQIRSRATLVTSYGGRLTALADESRLGQVVLNLLVNAVQAIPEGHPGENEIRVVTRADGPGRLIIEVTDTGCGIEPGSRNHIFEPFYTTKPLGVGTGLGLSICHGIVKALGGEIGFESVVGEGSTFRVVLPAALGQAPTPPGPPGPSSAAGPGAAEG